MYICTYIHMYIHTYTCECEQEDLANRYLELEAASHSYELHEYEEVGSSLWLWLSMHRERAFSATCILMSPVLYVCMYVCM